MMRVKLTKAFRVPGDRLRSAGSVVDVSREVLAVLKYRGVVEDTPAAEEAPAEVEDPVEGTPEVEDPVEGTPEVETRRPAKTAGIDKWRAYAKTQGVDPKGLDKQQIIAALT